MFASSRMRPNVQRLTQAGDGAFVALAFVAAIIVYLMLARLRVGPFIDNDEYIYGNLAQSIAAGDGRLWRGAATGLNSLYPYVIAPAWALSDGPDAFRLAQALGVVATCSIVWPLWLVSRTVTPRRWALIAPLLALAGVWMELSSKIMTEALAFPVVVWGLCATVLALRAPRTLWFWGALALGLVAVLLRAQAVGLLFVVMSASAVNVLRLPRPEWRSEARRRRGELVACAFLVVVALVSLTGVGDAALGSYAGVLDLRPSFGPALHWAGDHLSDLVLMTGVLPWIAVVALALQRSSWRDADLGPYLTVAVLSGAVFVTLAGWFAAAESSREIERYVAYAGPLALVALVPAASRARWRKVAVATILFALVMLLGHDPTRLGGEATSLNAFGDLLGWGSDPSRLGLVVLAAGVLLLGGLLSAGIHAAGRAGVSTWVIVTAAVTATLVMLFIPARSQWSADHRRSTAIKRLFGRAPSGVLRPQDGKATLVAFNIAPVVPLWVEFFNKEITRAVVQPAAGAATGYGPVCRFRLADDGSLTKDPRCAGLGTVVWLSTPPVVPTFRGGAGIRPASIPYAYVTRGNRLLALRQPICDDVTGACQAGNVVTFAGRPATLTLTFRGGQSPHQIAINGNISSVPAGELAAFRIPVGRGRQTTSVQGDWQAISPDVPTLNTVTLTERGRPEVTLN